MNTRSLIILSVLLLLSAYVILKLKRSGFIRGKYVPLFTWFLIASAVSGQFIYRFYPVNPELWFFQGYFWGGGIILGWLATFLIFSLWVDLGKGLFYLGNKVAKMFRREIQTDVSRRNYFAQIQTGGVLALSSISSLVGLGFIKLGPRVKEVQIPIATLPRGFSGLRIAQISDLHVGALILKKDVEFVVEEVLKLKPDVIVVTGDLADGTVELLKNSLEPLRRLKAPLGTFYVTGNHEYYWGVQQWLDYAVEMGWIPLMNENRILEKGETKILLAGVTDTSGKEFFSHHRSDPQAAVKYGGSVSAKILLAHRPSSCFEASHAGFDLQLSGHTHGGQFFPWSLFVPLANPYVRGLNRHENMWLYVNQGTGFWGPPNRLGYPSEITLLTLVPASGVTI